MIFPSAVSGAQLGVACNKTSRRVSVVLPALHRQEALNRATSGQRPTHERLDPSAVGFKERCFSLSLQPFTQSLLRYQSATPHSDCSQVFVLNRVIEEPKRKASHLGSLSRSIRHSRHCGSFVIPFPAPRRNLVPEHRRRGPHILKNMALINIQYRQSAYAAPGIRGRVCSVSFIFQFP
jgi:hypothetical protein